MKIIQILPKLIFSILLLTVFSCKKSQNKDTVSPIEITIETPQGMIWVPKRRLYKEQKEQTNMPCQEKNPLMKLQLMDFL